MKITFSKDKLLNFLKISEENQIKLNFYISACNWDLYYGPRPSIKDDLYIWRGYVNGVKEIQNIVGDSIYETIYYDNDCGEYIDKLPEGEIVDGEYIEPFFGEIYEVDIKEILFGSKLKNYIQ